MPKWMMVYARDKIIRYINELRHMVFFFKTKKN